MNLNEVIIEESGIEKNQSKEIILSLINNQIKKQKFQYRSEWERDHTVSTEKRDQKLKALYEKKAQVEKFFEDLLTSNNSVDITLSIHTNVDESKFHGVLEYSN